MPVSRAYLFILTTGVILSAWAGYSLRLHTVSPNTLPTHHPSTTASSPPREAPGHR